MLSDEALRSGLETDPHRHTSAQQASDRSARHLLKWLTYVIAAAHVKESWAPARCPHMVPAAPNSKSYDACTQAALPYPFARAKDRHHQTMPLAGLSRGYSAPQRAGARSPVRFFAKATEVSPHSRSHILRPLRA